ncbi:MAG TPA: VOC family protein [bacterium]|nr:VOC family protein [bacterium]
MEAVRMITGIQDFYYNVQDMDRAVAFYRDVLGMAVEDSSEWWSSLRCGGQRIGLHGTGGQPVPAVPRDSHGAHAGGTLTLGTDDIEAAVARLRAAGVPLLGDVMREEWGSIAVFEDPDGNVLKVMQPPA